MGVVMAFATTVKMVYALHPPYGEDRYLTPDDYQLPEDFRNTLFKSNGHFVIELGANAISHFLAGKQVLSEDEIAAWVEYWEGDNQRDETIGETFNRIAQHIRSKL